MMVKNVLFLLLLTTATVINSSAFAGILANADQDEPKNITDANGKKQGRWLYLGKDMPNKNYPEEGKIKEGGYEDDRKEGLWIMYYKDGATPKTKGTYTNNRPSGAFTKFWPNGTIKEQGNFVRNKYQDSLNRYNQDGVLVYQGVYNQAGMEEGTVTYFYDNGQPEFTYESTAGVPTGKAYRYWPNGDVKEIIEYAPDGSVITSEPKDMVNSDVTIEDPKASGKEAPKPPSGSGFKANAYNKVFNDDQEIWMEGDFKKGKLYDGRLYIYDEDGLLKKVEVYKEGRYHSDGQL